MQPVAFEGCFTIRRPDNMTDEECMDIPAAMGKDGKFTFFITAWKPSYEDLQALMRGEPVYVKVYAQRLPPMALFTLDEKGEVN